MSARAYDLAVVGAGVCGLAHGVERIFNGRMVMYSKTNPDAKPVGLIHVVIYDADEEQKAAAFTSREMAEAFAKFKSSGMIEPGSNQRCTIVDAVVDGQAVGAPIED